MEDWQWWLHCRDLCENHVIVHTGHALVLRENFNPSLHKLLSKHWHIRRLLHKSCCFSVITLILWDCQTWKATGLINAWNSLYHEPGMTLEQWTPVRQRRQLLHFHIYFKKRISSGWHANTFSGCWLFDPFENFLVVGGGSQGTPE